MNIDTRQGMEEAKAWLIDLIGMMADRAPWAIPRSRTIYEFDKVHKTAWLVHGAGDPDTHRVIEAIGWRVANEAERN